jgi:hypothetical protein
VDVDVDVSRHVTSAGLGVPTLTLTSPVDVELDGDGDGDMVDRAACSEPVATQLHCSDFQRLDLYPCVGHIVAMPTKLSR